jgi:hypothetical protein
MKIYSYEYTRPPSPRLFTPRRRDLLPGRFIKFAARRGPCPKIKRACLQFICNLTCIYSLSPAADGAQLTSALNFQLHSPAEPPPRYRKLSVIFIHAQRTKREQARQIFLCTIITARMMRNCTQRVCSQPASRPVARVGL